ncbi:MAG: D-tyrosyl-tRNA(Tyr) deacylase [Pyrinomonadaceae bacterium]|nr:D-tyrosyl-tRNA(Tyr) deacylase [Pyrinomonadaceae bacterium]
MRGVVQRVSRARVTVDGEVTGEIGKGILLLLGVSEDDTEANADYVLNKTVNLRIFEDNEGRMNRALTDIAGDLLVVSQFTLYGDVRKGLRPSFVRAASPDTANALYEYFVEKAKTVVDKVETGRFGAMMDVELVNDGPVTILIDSEKGF